MYILTKNNGYFYVEKGFNELFLEDYKDVDLICILDDKQVKNLYNELKVALEGE